MNISELINEIISEWAYRVDDGMPDAKNPAHLKELGIVLKEMGLSHIKDVLLENLNEKDKQFTNPILNKVIKYKNKKGEDKEGMVGNLLRLPKDNPGRVAAEKLLPADKAEKDAAMKDLGSEKDGKSAPKKPEEDPAKDGEGGDTQPKEDPIVKAAQMFDPKADPAMGARLDKEKEMHAKLADTSQSNDTSKKETEEPNPLDAKFNPIEAQDVQKEMPEADPDTFGGGGDIPDGVDPKDLEKFNTDIKKVGEIIRKAKANGEQTPNINLCDVTVPGTNLYCDDNLGIPRAEMPQFKGKPQPGTPASEMPADKNGEVDTEPLFKKMLEDKGIKIVQTEVPSDKLKATQSELVGDKVIGMMNALENDPNNEALTAPIYVSRDGYVIDGHHRWAAITAYNAAHPDNQIPMKVQAIDMDIKDAIPMCNKFAEEQGVAAKKADANKESDIENVTSLPKPKPEDPEEKKSWFQKQKERIQQKFKVMKEAGKQFFDRGGHKPGSVPRRSFGEALWAKVKGIPKAVGHGIVHHAIMFKDAGVAIYEAGMHGGLGTIEDPDTGERFNHDDHIAKDENGKKKYEKIPQYETDSHGHVINDPETGKPMQKRHWLTGNLMYEDRPIPSEGISDKKKELFYKSYQKEKKQIKAIVGTGKAIMITMAGAYGLSAAMGHAYTTAGQLMTSTAIELVPHTIVEGTVLGIGKAALFAGAVEMNHKAKLEEFSTNLVKEISELIKGDKEIPKDVLANSMELYNNIDKLRENMDKIPEDEAFLKDYIEACDGFAKHEKEQPNQKTKPEMTEENLQLADELMLEMIYQFIDEATPNAKAQNILNQRIKYKEDGVEHDVKVSTAIKYKNSEKAGQKKAYKDALALLKKSGVDIADVGSSKKPVGKKLGAGDFRDNKKEVPTEPQAAKPTKTNSIGDAIFAASKQPTDAKKQAFVDKKKDELNKLLFSMGDNNKLVLTDDETGKSVSINTLKLSKVIDKVFSGNPLNDEDKKLFNSCLKLVTNPDNGDVKIYVSSKIMGRHPQQGYKSIEIAKKNIPMGDSIREYALQNGLNVGKSSEGAIGKKVLTPVKMASSVNPDKPETIIEIKKTANGVTIGGKEMKRLKELNYDGLVKSLTPKYGPEEAAKKAKLLVLQTKAYNQKLDDLAKIGESSGGKIPMANFGDVTTPENRKKTASNILDGIVKRFESELDSFGKQFGKPNLKNTPENKKVFDSLNKLKALNAKANLETDEKARAEYKATLDQLLLDMANAPDFKDSVADFAEQKAGLQFLAEGKQVYFPASENFQTADIIVMPDEFSVKPKKGQTTEEAIAENLQFYSVTVTYVGGLSVKYKGGGGSANYSKIEQTEYNNPETKSKLLEMQNVYSLAYPKDKKNQLNIKDADIKAANKKIEDTIKWAIKAKLITKEEADLIRRIGAGQAGNTLKGGLKDVAKCKGANRKNFEQSIVLHHTMMHLTAVLNNRDMSYTRFSNFNEEVSQNKNGDATKITDDIADGVNKPCYMNPHHNPGFSTSPDETSGCVTGAPTNQNPSHIESEQPKNLLKAPK